MTIPPTLARLALGICLIGAIGGAQAQPYATLSDQPDPAAFVSHADTQLTLLGTALRFGGVNISWLGQRQDGAAPARRPTEYEIRDALQTAQALGTTVIRLPGLVDSAGCTLCLEPAAGQFSPEAFQQIDLVIKIASDLGLKIILPLADRGQICGPSTPGAICGTARLYGAANSAAFFTDPGLRAAFIKRVQTILTHTNNLTGRSYRDEPAILAWEDCDACSGKASDQAVSDWAESLGQAIKATDPRHVYEDGAFAGRIGPAAAHPVAVALYTRPSTDIIGDQMPTSGDPEAARSLLGRTLDDLRKTGRVYVMDSFGWGPALWKTQEDLEAWLNAMFRTRSVAGAFVSSLQAHANVGGYLPPASPTGPGQDSLYFPGTATPDMDLATMMARGRALRRFNFGMVDVTVAPTYLLPPRPEIIAAAHGRVAWRGAAGAATYSIERSPDPSSPGTFNMVCDECVTDAPGFWQDPDIPKGPAWYRVIPSNINGHKSLPTDPVKAQ